MLQAANMHSMSAGRSPQQRMVSIGIVAAIHIAVLAALITAFMPHVIPDARPIIVEFFPPNPVPTPPANRIDHLKLTDPTVPAVPEPEIKIKETTPPPVTRSPGVGGGNQEALPTRSPVALFSTHSTPPYPPIERRMGNEGNVLLRLTIDADGQVSSAEVVRSSGHEDLDRAAASWVKAHWRYLPALQDGIAVASATNALVTFRLTGAQN